MICVLCRCIFNSNPVMERDSFFTKLRSLGTTVENETAKLEDRMEKPIGFRSSGPSNQTSSQLKEMQQDARNVKINAQQTLALLKSESDDFQNVLTAMKSLIQVQKKQLEEREEYLQQYGYVPYKQYVQQQAAAKQVSSKKKLKASGKENIPQEKSDHNVPTNDGKNEALPAVSQQNNNVVTTPTKTKEQELDVEGKEAGNKTPQLSDFGLSQATLDRLAGLKGQKSTMQQMNMEATPARTDRTFNITQSTNGQHYPPMTTPQYRQNPMTTPQYQHHPMTTPMGQQENIPFSMGTVKVTPGIFGNRQISVNTPEHFIDKALPGKPDMEDSPVPPILSTVKKWPKSSRMAPPLQPTFDGPDDINGTSTPDLPEPPEMTVAWSEFIPPVAPQYIPSVSSNPSDVTPPMPVFQASMVPASSMPSVPTRLATNYDTNTMPQEPVQLAGQVQHGSDMPSRPVLLADKLGIAPTMPAEPVQLANQIPTEFGTPPPPVLLTQHFGVNHYIPSQATQPSVSSMPTPQQQPQTMVQSQQQIHEQLQHYQAPVATSHVPMATSELPAGVTPQKPASVMRLQDVGNDMPKTPEMTLSYKRFVDIKAPMMQPTEQVVHSEQGGPEGAGHRPEGAEHRRGTSSHPCQIGLIKPEEFNQVQDYLQRILPLNVINAHIDTLNQILTCKQDSSYITEEETKIVDLGPQLKVMLLLLSKFGRWRKGKSPANNEVAFFIS